ncbi:MAG: hypothetical protein JO314_10250 [Acidobacteria bacterium]|nr:hypothetical protein [Acidobacteriota bacterium]
MKKTEIDPTFNLPYEENEVRLKGIIYFGIGLVALIVVTFGLMWALLSVLKDYNKENQEPVGPLAMSEKERLPPEPRLQEAPGFGIDTDKGRVNLELSYPASEYKEFRAEWTRIWEDGQKDAKTGAVSVLPIEQAKEKVLASNPKVAPNADPDMLMKSRMYVSQASSGRVASEKRR